jgi:endonuclease/exonuclease/phosphatase family metal-dependent hydrolase
MRSVSVVRARLFHHRVFAAFFVALAFIGSVARAQAQTTVTLRDPQTQVVYATVQAGAYADNNQNWTLETKTTSNADTRRRALIKFDTQNHVPAGAAVTSAKLTVTVKSGGTDSSRVVAAYQTTQSWDENEVTWNDRRTSTSWYTSGGDLGTKLSQQTVSNAPGAKVTFDITPLVQQAVSGALGSSRYTRVALVDIDPVNEESRRIYYTSDDPIASNRPTLTVSYGGSSTTTSTPTVSTDTSGTTLKVLEYNVHHGGYGTDGKYDVNRIINVIAKINPDIISLCEMEKNDSWVSTDGVALYKSLLEQKTGVTWYSWDMQDYGDWSSGGIRNAILSKHPFASTYRHEFSVGKDRTVGGVTIVINGRNINFMSTHFDPDSGTNRAEQAKELVSYAGGFAENRILLGDFNAQPTSTPMLTLIAKYNDGWAEAKKLGIASAPPDDPNGYTRNSRIDFVLYSRGEANLTLKGVQVVETRDSNGVMPSDHRPLVATFTVK